MLRMIRSQLVHRASRTLALFLGMLVATTAFTVLTGASDTSRLVVRGEVAKNFRPAYDILVRPSGAATKLEQTQGLVRESYLSGQSGGITMAQYERIKALEGVDIAAPAAIIGYAMQIVHVPVDLSRYAGAPGSGRKVLRVDVARKVDSGLTTVPGEHTFFVYVTDDKITLVPADGQGLPNPYGPTEVVGGKKVTLCPWDSTETTTAGDSVINGPFSEYVRTETTCWQRGKVGVVQGRLNPEKGKDVTVQIPLSLPYLVAAVDPAAEAELVGLDGAVTEGRYLEDAEPWKAVAGPFGDGGGTDGPSLQEKQVPILMASRTFATGSDEITVSDLGAAGVTAMTKNLPPAELRPALLAQKGREIGSTSITGQQAFERLPGIEPPGTQTEGEFDYFGDLWTASPPTITPKGPRSVAVQAKQLDPTTLDYSSFSSLFQPLSETLDVPFRDLEHHGGNNQGKKGDPFFKIPRWEVVGRFDPLKVDQGKDLAAVPLSLYRPSSLTGADAAALAALKDGTLAPNGSMLGYAQEPPMMLTSIAAMDAFTAKDAYPTMAKAAKAPIGSIRVRVDGVVGIDPISRERVRKVAQSITDSTGLDVDIVVGSSPTPVEVALPAGKFGRPALNLDEGWVLKGVGVALLQAVDRKSMVLFGLILVVCSLFLANAASAAVRSRRTELGVLAALGWSRRMVFRAVLGELALTGLLAGLAGAALSWPIAALAGIQLSPWRALLAIPAAVVLAVLAGLWPARVAARSHPADAVRPHVTAPKRPTRLRSLRGMAWSNLRRVPGRALLGVVSLAVGVAALTVLLGITQAFRGAAVGTLLGDAITLQVRGVDYVAVIATIALGALATADVLYLGVRERAGEYSTLRALGWTERALSRVVTWEGLTIGVLGALTGAAIGVAVTAVFAADLPPGLVTAGAVAAGIGILVTLLALLVPVTAMRRLPTAALLAEEE
ncbi:ABC transporter permease [Knoellia sp. DB2414S]|uniref:ABC transporter permease n=2 Tax=Knoellia koreensis TaxID=2730921 RepID=A0A849H7P1_9MICO|nr:ABC transporter permease [Knoellia sp. DB2414S]